MNNRDDLLLCPEELSCPPLVPGRPAATDKTGGDDAPLGMLASAMLRRLLEDGMPIHPRPYALLAELVDSSEDQVLRQVAQWQREGLFRRFGMVIRHRTLGISANVMLVIDAPDSRVDAIGQALARADGVNLCYRRPRRLPDWPYNLFCMIHGRDRAAVQEYANTLLGRHGLAHRPHALLFSVREFKQRGARYIAPDTGARHG